MNKNTEEFYDKLSSKYTKAILRCVPRYSEMIDMLFFYLPDKFQPKRILELGCGTGNLTVKIIEHFKDAKITAVDISADIINICKERANCDNVDFLKSDFIDLNFKDNSFDFVISSIAIHHLQNNEKQNLFNKIAKWLTPSGIFTFSDQFKGETEGLYEKHMKLWKDLAFANKVPVDEWETWMEHQRLHDFHETINNHVGWLNASGLKNIDVVWKYALWTVIQCRKV